MLLFDRLVFERRGRTAPILLGLGSVLVALLSTGCGSSSTSATARVRGADLSVNGGTTGVLVNSVAVGGDLTFNQVSPYNYVGQGVSTFSFSTSAPYPVVTASGAATTAVVPQNPQLQLNNGSYYSAYLIGRIDAPPLTAARADPRFLQTVVAGDKGAAGNYSASTAGTTVVPYADPPSGEANVRILNAAPDAGPVDVLIGGKVVFPAVSYPLLPLTVIVPTGTTNGTPAVNPVTAYAAQPSGTLSVQVNAAGTSTVLVPATNVSVGSGGAYTLVVTEPTVAPTYSLTTESDD